MASNIVKKSSLNIKNAVVDITDDDGIVLFIDDEGEFNLVDLLKDFNGATVSISVGTTAEID